MSSFHFFDREEDVAIVQKKLPHWSQVGAMPFITWRTADSLPAVALNRIADERAQLLASLGLDPAGDWKQQLEKLPAINRSRLQWSLFEIWDRQLDSGAGDGAVG